MQAWLGLEKPLAALSSRTEMSPQERMLVWLAAALRLQNNIAETQVVQCKGLRTEAAEARISMGSAIGIEKLRVEYYSITKDMIKRAGIFGSDTMKMIIEG